MRLHFARRCLIPLAAKNITSANKTSCFICANSLGLKPNMCWLLVMVNLTPACWLSQESLWRSNRRQTWSETPHSTYFPEVFLRSCRWSADP